MSRRRLAIALAVVLVVSGTVAVAAPSGPATVDEQAERLDDHPRALLISDSAWLGIKTYGAVDAVQGFDHMLDLASCRRRVVTSCTNYDGHVPIPLYDEVVWRGGSYETLIVATGYNDSDSAFRDEVDAIVDLARSNGYRRVLWLTLRSNVTYTSPGSAGFAEVFENNNNALLEIVDSGVHPELVIADWAAYARDRDEWFARDGIHLRGDGPWAAADYVSRKMAYLSGVACAQPERAGEPRLDPCPDPDATGARVDLSSLYPIGENAPFAPFALEWEGTSSWPEPPWWESS